MPSVPLMVCSLRVTPLTGGASAVSASNRAWNPCSAPTQKSRLSCSGAETPSGGGSAAPSSPNGAKAATILGSARGSSRSTHSGDPSRPGRTGAVTRVVMSLTIVTLRFDRARVVGPGRPCP